MTARRAFTLLETLLALSVTALVMAALAPAVATALRGERHARERLASLAQEAAAVALLRDDLLALPRPVGDGLTRAFVLAGEADAPTLEYLADEPPALHPTLARRPAGIGQSLRRWELSAAGADGTRTLRRSADPHLLAAGAPPPAEPEDVLDRLAALEIDALDAAGGWLRTWNSDERDGVLPAALRIAWIRLNADGTPAPRRVAVLPLTRSALDPLQQAAEAAP